MRSRKLNCDSLTYTYLVCMRRIHSRMGSVVVVVECGFLGGNLYSNALY